MNTKNHAQAERRPKIEPPQWIKFSTRFPTGTDASTDGKVLVAFATGRIDAFHWEVFSEKAIRENIDTFAHWMPLNWLPRPPHEED